MLTNLVESSENPLIVTPSPMEIVLDDDGSMPVTLVLPSLEDFIEMRVLKDNHFSLKELATKNWFGFMDVFVGRLNALEMKRKRFGNSPNYLNRLANLAEMAGMKEKEAEYLREARKLSDDNFFVYRMGDNLLATNKTEEAEILFSKLDLKSDLYANLRMAYFNIQRQNFDLANEFVMQALRISPLNFGARMMEGALGIVQGNYNQAIRSFRVAGEDRPRSSSVYTNMAVAYIYLRNPLKALAELKKAVALEPLNLSAVTLLADLAFMQKCDEDAVPSMRFFLQFEQKNSEVWARLARAMLRLKNIDEAILSLKNQGSIKNSSAVWNNLGVAYSIQKNYKKASESLIHALKMGSEEDRSYYLAARNFAQLLSDQKKFSELTKFTSVFLSNDTQQKSVKEPVLSDIWEFHLHSLCFQGRMHDFVNIIEELIYRPDITPRLQVWLVSSLIAHLALTVDGAEKSIAIIEKFKYLEDKLSLEDKVRKVMLLNNIAFAYAENGNYEMAEEFLRKISDKIHRDPYPTATLGLINFRKGHIERGKYLYEEAIHLAQNKSDKIRIRQKLNFELAKLYLSDNASKANRYLQKVVAQSEGAPELVSEAIRLQKCLLKYVDSNMGTTKKLQ